MLTADGLRRFAGRDDLRAAFRADPFAYHGAELAEILQAFRSRPLPGNWVLVMVLGGREWTPARWDAKGEAIALVGPPLPTREAAEIWVFDWRWREMIGP